MTRLTSILFSALSAAVIFVLFQPAHAQQDPKARFAAEGYITAVHLPEGFDVNGQRILLERGVTYGLEKETTSSTDSPFSNNVQVGAYAFVEGKLDRKSKSVLAHTVRFRDDLSRKLSGLGVICRVVSTGPEPVFQADGYPIRITPATRTTFQGTLHSMADVGTNIWLRYEGTRGNDGVLVATEAQFIPAKSAKVKALKGWEVTDMDFHPPASGLKDSAVPPGSAPSPLDASDQDAVLTKDGYVRWGITGGKHKIPANHALQARVRRIGMMLVPAYQRQLPDADPSKIHFRFYAVDARKMRSDICSYEGLILVPVQLVERLQNDDQLAAVLADGVAFNLQRQMARLVVDSRVFLATSATVDTALFLLPGVGIAGLIANSVAASKILQQMEEQRGRIALSLMADAGFDPRQAPEAWRLLAPKKLPADLDSLKYPDIAGYQLGILNLQYNQPEPGAGASSPAPAPDPAQTKFTDNFRSHKKQ